MSALVKHNGLWKETDEVFVKHNGLWKEPYKKNIDFLEPGDAAGGGFVGFVNIYDENPYMLIIADASDIFASKTVTNVNNLTEIEPFNFVDGRYNTNLMDDDVKYPAAAACRGYRGGGYDDWYLAAYYEWDHIILALHPNKYGIKSGWGHGEFQALNTASSYWSSTINPDDTRIGFHLQSNRMTTRDHKYGHPVRPIRRVSLEGYV